MVSHDKKSASELRKELRELRKQHLKPVSRMRMGDISTEIERLRGAREETPAVVSVPSAPPKSMKPAVKSIKEAKKSEFPVAPGSESVEKKATAKKAAPSKKKDMMAKLLKMMEEEDDD